MITEQELKQFIEAGAVTIDTPLTDAQVRGAAAALDRLLPFEEPPEGQKPRYRYSLTCSYDAPELLDIIQHPFFEEVAKRALQADEVRFFQTAITNAYPQPDTPFGFEQHVDIQYCASDFQATPRKMICSYFLWLTDVNERRAPMMVRPGSHWLIAAERERNPETRGVTPTVAGVSLAQLPALDYAEPIPLTAKAGQVSVLTTGAVHGASTNVDTEARKVLVLTFTPADMEIGLPPNQETQRLEYNRELRERLRPERAYIVPV